MAAVEIDLEKLPFDLDFHPSDHLVATGLITDLFYLFERILIFCYMNYRLFAVHAHTESCRAVRFINDGRTILTGSPDCSILATDVETGSEVARVENSHGAAVNRIVNLTESTIASGDDEGCVKVWDTRQNSCSNSFHVHEEYISDITFARDSMKLLATSGDGTLSVCNLRSNKVIIGFLHFTFYAYM
nr:WD repeat-containing protein 55 [Ipomoea batatas]